MKNKIDWSHPVFLKIAEDNDFCCMITDKPISRNSVGRINFHHIKPKSRYPELMYDEENIVFCTTQIHMDLESMTKDKYHRLVGMYPKLAHYFDYDKLK